MGKKIADGTPGRGPAGPAGDRGLPGSTGMTATRHDQDRDAAGGVRPARVVRPGAGAARHRLPGRRGRGRGHPRAPTAAARRRRCGRSAAWSPPVAPVSVYGTSLAGKKTEAITKLGVAHVPQGRGTFADLSVDDNMRLGAFVRKDKDVQKDIDGWYEVFPILGAAGARSRPGSCPAASSRCSPIARALMGNPRLLLLDEPSLGPRADHHPGPVRAAAPGQARPRDHHAGGRAERQPGAGHGRPRLRPGGRRRSRSPAPPTT